MWPGVLLTGPPGIGKSTACRKVVELCEQRGLRVEGFLTEELREKGNGRVGFDLVGLGSSKGQRAPLARVKGVGKGPKVGKYTVTLSQFEEMVFPILDKVMSVPASKANEKPLVIVLDEIGKMELFSNTFVSRMRELLNTRPAPSLITVAMRGQGLIEEAKRVQGFELIELSQENRDDSPSEILAKLLKHEVAGRGVTSSLTRPSAAAATTTSSSARRWQSAASVSGTSEASEEVAPSSRWRARRQPPVDDGAAAESGRGTLLELKSTGPVVVWLRSELRLADNALLSEAIRLCAGNRSIDDKQTQRQLLLVICLDPREFDPSSKTALGSPKVGEARRQFLQECVADLEASVEQRGSKLMVCEAAPEDALPAIANNCGAAVVLATSEACPEERSAELRTAKALQVAGTPLKLLSSAGATTLFGSTELQDAGLSGDPSKFPEEFQEFYGPMRRQLPNICQLGLCDSPVTLPPAPVLTADPPGLRGSRSLAKTSGSISADPKFEGGEKAAHTRLHSWLGSGALGRYKSTFRSLLGDYSSRLSPHLAVGCISARRVAFEVLKTAGSSTSPHIDHYIYELCWRDFFRHAARRWGSSLFKREGPLGQRGSASSAWKRNQDVEERWRKGLTGVPLVDAAMRELLSTGYMGNLARQIAAAFLVEELNLDWRVGADWFETALVDYDPHSNWGQWARSAGVAPTNDAKRRRVGGTRYYDIALGIPNGEAARYVKAWLPELSGLPDRYVFAPWLLDSDSRAALGRYPLEPLASAELRRYFEKAHTKGKGGKDKGKGGDARSKGKVSYRG